MKHIALSITGFLLLAGVMSLPLAADSAAGDRAYPAGLPVTDMRVDPGCRGARTEGDEAACLPDLRAPGVAAVTTAAER